MNEVTLHIHAMQDGRNHDYCALVGPYPEPGMPDFRVHGATLDLVSGWAMLTGQFPVSETDLVSTSADGTTMAIRAQQNPRQDYVYNLDSHHVVYVRVAGVQTQLAPRQYVIVAPGSTGGLQPRPIPDADLFVTHMYDRARALEFECT